MNYRPLRVGKLIREELAEIVLREVEFPDAFVTITGVDVDKKLETAVVRLGVLPPSSGGEVMKIIKGAGARLQRLLTEKINIKPMPRIRFEIDHGTENAAKIEKLLIDEDRKQLK
jgi:ribosome-binding factor A